jgi:hypothetical protein
LASGYATLAEAAVNLSNEDLDREIPGYGGRPTPIRNLLYGAANHTREHVNHVNKILDVTGNPGQSEARAILEQGAQALGALNGALLRVDDGDLARSHEDQSIKDVLEHVAGALDNFVNFVSEGTKA